MSQKNFAVWQILCSQEPILQLQMISTELSYTLRSTISLFESYGQLAKRLAVWCNLSIAGYLPCIATYYFQIAQLKSAHVVAGSRGSGLYPVCAEKVKPRVIRTAAPSTSSGVEPASRPRPWPTGSCRCCHRRLQLRPRHRWLARSDRAGEFKRSREKC